MSESEPKNPIVQIIAEHGKHGWDLLWKADLTRWDRGEADPFLVSFLRSPPAEVEIPKGGMGLVAGCGRVSRRAPLPSLFHPVIISALTTGLRRGRPC